MVEYIYFVKCPNCEDEHFDFFDEAKAFAMSCMSKKPIITQTEVCRNDFGECTDHCDLGTVWSWEDVMKETGAEPSSIFTKADVDTDYDPDSDPEFEDEDFFAVNELDEDVKISFNNKDDQVEFLKLCSEVGIKTPADIDRFMKDTGATDADLLSKLREYRAELGDDFKVKECVERKPVPEGMTIEELVEEMEENEDTVECTWCEELFDKSECRKEVNLGWLCSRCEAAIKSRGETLTFREGNYWDFLDEKLGLDIDFSQIVDSSDMEIWGVEPIGEDTYKAVLMKRFENVSFRGYDEIEKVEAEMFDIGGLFVFHFGKDGLPRLGRWDPELLNSLGGCEIIFDDERYDQAVEETLNGSASKREEPDPDHVHDLGNTYDGGYPANDKLEELEEAADYRKRLAPCPECGAENTFDHETGFCLECGFNL